MLTAAWMNLIHSSFSSYVEKEIQSTMWLPSTTQPSASAFADFDKLPIVVGDVKLKRVWLPRVIHLSDNSLERWFLLAPCMQHTQNRGSCLWGASPPCPSWIRCGSDHSHYPQESWRAHIPEQILSRSCPHWYPNSRPQSAPGPTCSRHWDCKGWCLAW